MSTASSLTTFGKFMGKNSDYIEVQQEYLSLDILPGPNDFLFNFFPPLYWNSGYVLLKTRTKVAGKSKAIMSLPSVTKGWMTFLRETK